MKILNLVVQVDESQHLSEERVLINYMDDENNPQVKIVNVSELTTSENNKYEAFKTVFTGKI